MVTVQTNFKQAKKSVNVNVISRAALIQLKIPAFPSLNLASDSNIISYKCMK